MQDYHHKVQVRHELKGIWYLIIGTGPKAKVLQFILNWRCTQDRCLGIISRAWHIQMSNSLGAWASKTTSQTCGFWQNFLAISSSPILCFWCLLDIPRMHWQTESSLLNSLAPGWFEQKIKRSSFQGNISYWWLGCLLSNCPHMNVNGPYWCKVIIGSGNGLVPLDNKPCYLSQCWHRSVTIYGVTRPQQVNSFEAEWHVYASVN